MFAGIFSLFIFNIIVCFAPNCHCTRRPVIGILAVDAYPEQQIYGNFSFLSTYVRYLQSAGSRVVPLIPSWSEEDHKETFQQINGVLIPGGYSFASPATSRAAQFYINAAIEANRRGDYFPIWGTCLGFEALTTLLSTSGKILATCEVENQLLPLKVASSVVETSRLLRSMPRRLLKAMTQQALAPNFHHYCLTAQNFTAFGVDRFLGALATSVAAGSSGVLFIAAVEGKELPFYAVQFHPEMNVFMWNDKANLSHTTTAWEISNYFARFFVEESLKNQHSFRDERQIAELSLDRLCPEFDPKKPGEPPTYFFD